MKKAFSLIELLIVVSILGIMAAIVIPMFQDNTQQAKEAAAKDNLRIIRSAIELYAHQHNDVPPGYTNGDTNSAPSAITLAAQLTGSSKVTGETALPGTAGFDYGPYLSVMAENPFNDEWGLTMIVNGASFPAVPTGNIGWYYKAESKSIKLDWPGTDSEGITYFEY